MEVSRLHARLDLMEKSFSKAEGGAHTSQVEQVTKKAKPTLPAPTSDFNRMVNQKFRNIIMKNPTILLQGQNVKRTVEGDQKQMKITWSLMAIQCGMSFLRDKICPQLGESGTNLLTTFSPEGGVSHIKYILVHMHS